MNDLIKKIGKVALHMVLWVFILSIKWDGRPMFQYANEVFVQNQIVRAVDDELGDLWRRVSKTAKTTFSKTANDADEAM